LLFVPQSRVFGARPPTNGRRQSRLALFGDTRKTPLKERGCHQSRHHDHDEYSLKNSFVQNSPAIHHKRKADAREDEPHFPARNHANADRHAAQVALQDAQAAGLFADDGRDGLPASFGSWPAFMGHKATTATQFIMARRKTQFRATKRYLRFRLRKSKNLPKERSFPPAVDEHRLF
jgi:hypothetical protein